jgi:hypothetical protein
MPKPMFMLLTVEAVAFGPVFQRLKNMEGVVAINLDGEPDKPNGKPAPTPGGLERYKAKTNGTGREVAKGTDAAGTSLRCILLDYLNEAERACPSVELMKKAEDSGYAPSTYSNVAYGLGRNKLAKRGKHGWTLTAKGKKYLATSCKLSEDE